MQRTVHFLISAVLIVALAALRPVNAQAPPAAQAPETGLDAEALARLVAAYPSTLQGVDGNELVFRNGTRMLIDRRRVASTHEDLLAHADLKAMLAQPYGLGQLGRVPDVNEDPGRARATEFFQKIYGDCFKGGVAADLVDVVWLPTKWGKPLKFSKLNGAAARLEAVSRELDTLPSAFDRFLLPPAGTYVCRPIAGTQRASAHGFGIAIDLAVAHSDYWQWAGFKVGDAVRYRNRVPFEIVEIFERHGFVWGGKWYHFDTMHFEYRPELVPPSRPLR